LVFFTKYPTVDAVNSALTTKADLVGGLVSKKISYLVM
jgi:hypothetical protein